MTVPELLLDCLEQLNKNDFRRFKWHLQQHKQEGYKPIPPSYLEDAERTKTVSKMVENYKEDGAVMVAVDILKKQQMNDLAQKLSNAHQEILSTVSSTTSSSGTTPETSPAAVLTAAVAGPPAAVAAPPAAVAMPSTNPSLVANEGSVIFAPIISGSEAGTWNVTLTKN